MKRMLALLMIVSFAVPAVHADDDMDLPTTGRQVQRRRSTLEQRIDRLAKVLKLSPDQRIKVADIVRSRQIEMDRIADQARTLRDKTDQEIGSVLTPDQRAKFDDLRTKSREKADTKRITGQ